MTDNDLPKLQPATARQLGRNLRTPCRRLRSRQLLTTMKLLQTTVRSYRPHQLDARNRTRRTQQLENAIDRLELITAGDEQLIDDLGAIETAQIELVVWGNGELFDPPRPRRNVMKVG